MTKTLQKFITGFSLLSVLIWSSGAVAFANQIVDDNESNGKKITICHTTEAENNSFVQIEVAKESVASHLEHGDQIGNCPTPPTVEVLPGEWCSALVGIMSSATLRDNNVIDVDDSGASDLTDTQMVAEWYDSGNNTACLESFGPEGEFNQENYENIDWCAGLVKGIQDTIGSQRGDAKFSEIFDVNNDGVTNLSDVSFMASLLALNDQAVCYAHYVPPMPDWSQEEQEPVVIKAHKIVCDNETDLPNMSGSEQTINAKTAQAIVDNSDGNCHFEADWQFQWGTNDSVLGLEGDFVGRHLDAAWSDFDSLSGNNVNAPAEVSIDMSDVPEDNKLWFREVLQANYIPFTYPMAETTNKDNNVSAEFWCDQDVLNYDNAEWINVSEGETYYCLAINVLKESEPEEIIPGEWCSALVGIMSSATLRDNNVIDVDDSGASDLTDTQMVAEWYDSGNNTACLESFGPEGEFNQENYENIDWCAGLVKGIQDTIGSQRGDAKFSEIFDLNNDGKTNLSDVAVVASLVALGNQASCYAHYVPPMPEWEIPDTTAPVITLLGNNPENVYVNSTYTDAGATAMDNIDGNITANIVVTGTVNTDTIGTYTLTYNVSDSAGNPATPVTRTVNVIPQGDGEDTTAPVITLLGNNPENVYVNSTYTDAGATAMDNIDGNITANIVVTGTVNTDTIGTYTLTYNVSDSAGNPATPVTRTVNVTARSNGGGGGGGGGYRPQMSFINIKAQTATSSANVTWDTSLASHTWIIYGTTTEYGKEFRNTIYAQSHTAVLNDLLPNTTYHYQLRSFDNNTNVVYDIDRTFTTNGNGIPPQVLGTKEFACVPDIDGDIKDITKFANGVLLRGCGPEVYHIVDGKKFHIPNWQYLHDNYFAIRIYNISDENLVQFPDTDKDNVSLKKILKGVLGTKTYANGTLLRGSDKKVYIITNGKKVYISSLEELKKYAGRKIYDVTDTVLNQY